MYPIHAACLSFSQGEGDVSASASLSATTEDTHIGIKLIWTDLPAVKPGHAATDWLYWVLVRLVEEFDDHELTYTHVEGVELMTEGTDDA